MERPEESMKLDELPVPVGAPEIEPETEAGRARRTGVRRPALAVAVVAGIMLCLLMGALDNFVVLTALHAILTNLSAPPTGSTFIVSAYLITSTVAVPIFAKLSDLFDRKRIFIAGLGLFIGGSILAGLSQTFSELVIFRAVQGFGSGDFFPVGLSIVAVIFPPETRARVTGLLSGVFGIATVAGPFVGAFIVEHTTWRWVFYANIPIGLIGLTLLLVALGPIRPERKGRFDIPGAALLAGWVAALMYTLVEVSEGVWTWSDPRVVPLLLTAGVLLVTFVWWEVRRAVDPLVPLRLFSRRIVASSAGTTFLVGLVLFPLATFLTFLVTYVTLGNTGDVADTVRDVLYFLVIPLVFGAAIGGNLLTRVPYRPLVLVGIGISIVGLLLLTQVRPSTPVWVFAYGFLPVGGIVAPLIPIGFGVGMTFPVFLLAVQNQVPEAEVGAASGLVQFFQSLGGAIGLTLLASFQAQRLAALDPSEVAAGLCPPYPGFPTTSACAAAVSESYVQLFEVLVVLAVLAFVLALFLSGRLPKGKKPLGAGPP